MNIKKIVKEEVKKIIELTMHREDEMDNTKNNFRKSSPMFTKTRTLKQEGVIGMFNSFISSVFRANLPEKQKADKFASLLTKLYQKYPQNFYYYAADGYGNYEKLDYENEENNIQISATNLMSGRDPSGKAPDKGKYDININHEPFELKRFQNVDTIINNIAKDLKKRYNTTSKNRDDGFIQKIDNFSRDKELREAKTKDTAMKPNKKTEDDKAIETIRKDRAKVEKEVEKKETKLTDDILDKIAKKLGVDFHHFSKAQLKKGMTKEKEHDDITHGDLLMTAKLTITHLKENPKYYDALENMEKRLDDKKIELKTKVDIKPIKESKKKSLKEAYVRHLINKKIKRILKEETLSDLMGGGENISTNTSTEHPYNKGMKDFPEYLIKIFLTGLCNNVLGKTYPAKEIQNATWTNDSNILSVRISAISKTDPTDIDVDYELECFFNFKKNTLYFTLGRAYDKASSEIKTTIDNKSLLDYMKSIGKDSQDTNTYINDAKIKKIIDDCKEPIITLYKNLQKK